MDSVKYILGQPEVVDGIEIYPVKVKDYDEFMKIANILIYSKERFIHESANTENKVPIPDNVELLDMVMQFQAENFPVVDYLIKIFSLVCQAEIQFVYTEGFYGFKIDDDLYINRYNYDEIRKTILKQNLIFEPKIYKYKSTQKIAEKIMKSKAKNSLNSTIEDMISTVIIGSGLSFDNLKECTIYQVQHMFRRILQFENYKRDVLFQTVDTEGKIRPEHFAEEIIFDNPYKDLFKNKSQFTNLKQAGFDLDKA